MPVQRVLGSLIGSLIHLMPHDLQEVKPHMDADQLEALTNTELRDELLAHSPLDRDWVAAINQVG